MSLGRGRGVVLAAVISAAALCAAHPSPARAGGLDTGIYEPDYASKDAATQTAAFDHTAQARASFALIYVDWSQVAPGTRPVGFVPTDPADPHYRWSAIDAGVRDAAARGLKVVIAVTRAPNWAEGPGRPSQSVAPTGTWKPNPSDVGDFARAIASRYSGTFAGLPAVRYWQLWAEPNLGVNLSPQFQGRTPVGFTYYRPMLDAFYANVKAVSSQNTVVTGGTAPYGGLTPARGLFFQRMQPLTFWRGLLCESIGKPKKKKRHRRAARPARIPGCTPPRFDVASHHAINVGAPTRHAVNPDDASTPDIGRVRKVIRRGVGNKPIWDTEIWWNSNPPGRGVSLTTQARYLSQSFYILWRQGVQAVFWFELRDLEQNGRDPIPTSGLMFRNYQAKPAFQAFSFPFAVQRISRSNVRVWGLAPHAGSVSIRSRGHTVKTLGAGADRVFTGVIRLGGKAQLQASQGSESSLVAPEFSLRR